MPKKHDWSKEQPHDPNDGTFVSRKKAEAKPEKYTWVTEKKKK